MIKIVLGDEWEDGHGISETFLFDVNYTHQEILAAYQMSCKHMSVRFDVVYPQSDNVHEIAVTHGANTLLLSVVDIFIANGCTIEELVAYDGIEITPDLFFELLFWFIGVSLPTELIYKDVTDDIPSLGLCLGYGLYGE